MPRKQRVTRAMVRECVLLWRDRLLLHDWTIKVHFKSMKNDWGLCEAKPEYREVDFYIDLKGMTPEELDETVRHELIHSWTWGLWSVAHDFTRSGAAKELARREHEGMTTKLSQIVAVAYRR